jgi:hypothetical protein
LTTEAATKFVPLTVRVKPAPPAAALVGEIVVIAGTVLVVTEKFTTFEMPPPGAGLVTVTGTVRAEATPAAGMAAVNCVELTSVVAGVVPPKLTIEAATKFVPLTISVKPAPPAAALVGEILAIVGLVIVGLLPPHPARNTEPTIPKITSPLISAVLLFIINSRLLAQALAIQIDSDREFALHVRIVPIL